MGTLHVFHGTDRVTAADVEDPETEADGDRFWIWIEGDVARIGFEEWEGQADAVLPTLLRDHPEVAESVVDAASPAFEEGTTLSQVASTTSRVVTAAEVEVLFHGTRADRLPSILTDGLKGHMSPDERMWAGSVEAEGVVHFCTTLLAAASYAEHAARSGGDPVVLEVDVADLDVEAFVADRDFSHLADRAAWTHGALSSMSEAEASLTSTGKVGHLGDVGPGRLRAVHLRVEGGWTSVVPEAFAHAVRPFRP